MLVLVDSEPKKRSLLNYQEAHLFGLRYVHEYLHTLYICVHSGDSPKGGRILPLPFVRSLMIPPFFFPESRLLNPQHIAYANHYLFHGS